jgi:hypothetical protein
MQDLFCNAAEKPSGDTEKLTEFIVCWHKINSGKMFDTPVIQLMLLKQIVQFGPPAFALRNQIRAVEIQRFNRVLGLASIHMIQAVRRGSAPIRQIGKKRAQSA